MAIDIVSNLPQPPLTPEMRAGVLEGCLEGINSGTAENHHVFRALILVIGSLEPASSEPPLEQP